VKQSLTRFINIEISIILDINREKQGIKMGDRRYFVYIMTNKNNNVLYTGMTNNLVWRVYQHKNKLLKGFTNRYNCIRLVYYEIYNDPYSAITREKQIKAGSRRKKLETIEKINPLWKDFSSEF